MSVYALGLGLFLVLVGLWVLELAWIGVRLVALLGLLALWALLSAVAWAELWWVGRIRPALLGRS